MNKLELDFASSVCVIIGDSSAPNESSSCVSSCSRTCRGLSYYLPAQFPSVYTNTPQRSLFSSLFRSRLDYISILALPSVLCLTPVMCCEGKPLKQSFLFSSDHLRSLKFLYLGRPWKCIFCRVKIDIMSVL